MWLNNHYGAVEGARQSIIFKIQSLDREEKISISEEMRTYHRDLHENYKHNYTKNEIKCF